MTTTNIKGGHDLFCLFVVQLEDAVQNADFVVPERLFALPVEGKERPGVRWVW